MAPFIINPEVASDVQPRSTRVLGVPDFFAEYRETGNGFAAFLGSTITGKVSVLPPFMLHEMYRFA